MRPRAYFVVIMDIESLPGHEGSIEPRKSKNSSHFLTTFSLKLVSQLSLRPCPDPSSLSLLINSFRVTHDELWILALQFSHPDFVCFNFEIKRKENYSSLFFFFLIYTLQLIFLSYDVSSYLVIGVVSRNTKRFSIEVKLDQKISRKLGNRL